MLGISEESKAYRLFDPVKQRIVISRDVVCSENEKWNWQNNKKTGAQDKLVWEGHCDSIGGDTSEVMLPELSQSNGNSALENEMGTEEQNTNEAGPLDISNNTTDQLEVEITGTSSTLGRSRRKPAWLQDYVTNQELKEEEEEEHGLAMFVAAGDPVSLKKLIKM